jgi:DNA-binding NarL/FixJ family response regulator
MTIRVLVADDQSMVRAGFRMLLAREPDIEVVAEASNGREAVHQASRLDPTVVLMDIRMPELDGLHARRILATDKLARILILTTFDLDEYVYEALSAGASGFVLKDDPPEQLIAAIRTVAAGDALLSPAITKRVISQFTRIRRPTPPKELGDLTAREHEVFRLIARGLSNAEIAHQLYIGEGTVNTSPTSSRSSTCATASRPSCSPTKPGSSTRTPARQAITTSAAPGECLAQGDVASRSATPARRTAALPLS